MTIIEIGRATPQLTFRQRWSHYLALIFAAIGLFIGFNLRESILFATTQYVNPQAGITAEYPQNWLLQEGSGEYIFRVSDVIADGFKTRIQVAVRPVSAETTTRNIFDSLTLTRAQTLAAYNVVAETPFVLPDGTTTSAMTYSYVAAQTNPFLQTIPIVVEGIDVLIIERGQAIIVSFLSDANTFDANFPTLERFLRSIEF
ncbi:MAG: hypothetical protein CL610_09860 [Anaerolineaceae bacterium]|nr:hypothetical protein [Anaerolineaceae bacterium]